MRKQVKLEPLDIYLLCVVFLLVLAGVLLVFDASYAKTAEIKSYGYDTWYFAKRQGLFAAIGLALMLLVSRVPLEAFRRFSKPLLYVAFAILMVVLLPGLGSKSYGARSWFRFGSISVQPSELAKLILVIFLASALSRPATFKRRAPQKLWIPPLLAAVGIILLIVMERDLGTAVLVSSMVYAVFFAAGAKKRWLIISAVGGIVLVAFLTMHMGHSRARVAAFLDPWAHRYDNGYQVCHSLMALGTGGIQGVGLCEGREKTYMPASSTDYIFATLGEETGLIGGLLLLFGYVVFIYRGLDIARRCKSGQAALLAVGVTAMVGIQALVNLAVVTNSIPATGLPLPFISYGGSALVILLMGVGVLLSVSRQVNVEQDDKDLDEGSTDRWRNGRPHISRNQHRTGASRGRVRRGATIRR